MRQSWNANAHPASSEADGGQDFALSGSVTPGATGAFEGTITGFNPANRTTGNAFTLYMIDGTQGVAIEADNALLTLARLALVQ